MTFREYAARWHERLSDVRLSETVKRNYWRSLELHIFPVIGDTLITEITRDEIEDLFRVILPEKRKKNGDRLLGLSALKNIFTPLSLVFKRAVEDDEILERSPVLEKFAPRKADIQDPPDLVFVPQLAKQARFLIQEANRLKEPPHIRLWLHLQFYGLRQGERNGLTWDKVLSLHSKTELAGLKIDQQLVFETGRGHYVKDKLKTKNSEREFPIDNNLRALFIEYKREQDRWKKSPDWQPWEGEKMDNLVLTREDGSPLVQKVDTRRWHAYTEARFHEDEEHRTWRQHLNRHITATLFHQLGISLEDAQRVLGHGDKEMTRYYTQMSRSTLNNQITAYGNLINMTAEDHREMIRLSSEK